MPAAIGMALAAPERRAVCVIGEGSAQYSIQALWTAATYGVPVTFLVLRNDEYAILKWFGELEQATGAPALDLPALDTVAVAAGYGVPATRAGGSEELEAELRDALSGGRPAPRRDAGRARHGHGVAPTCSRGAVAGAAAVSSRPLSRCDFSRSRTNRNSSAAMAISPASRKTAAVQSPVASRSAPLTAGDEHRADLADQVVHAERRAAVLGRRRCRPASRGPSAASR